MNPPSFPFPLSPSPSVSLFPFSHVPIKQRALGFNGTFDVHSVFAYSCRASVFQKRFHSEYPFRVQTKRNHAGHPDHLYSHTTNNRCSFVRQVFRISVHQAEATTAEIVVQELRRGFVQQLRIWRRNVTFLRSCVRKGSK